MKYRIIAGPRADKAFEDRVTVALNAGWRLHGSLVAVAGDENTQDLFCQPMTHEEEQDSERKSS